MTCCRKPLLLLSVLLPLGTCIGQHLFNLNAGHPRGQDRPQLNISAHRVRFDPLFDVDEHLNNSLSLRDCYRLTGEHFGERFWGTREALLVRVALPIFVVANRVVVPECNNIIFTGGAVSRMEVGLYGTDESFVDPIHIELNRENGRFTVFVSRDDVSNKTRKVVKEGARLGMRFDHGLIETRKCLLTLRFNHRGQLGDGYIGWQILGDFVNPSGEIIGDSPSGNFYVSKPQNSNDNSFLDKKDFGFADSFTVDWGKFTHESPLAVGPDDNTRRLNEKNDGRGVAVTSKKENSCPIFVF